MFDESTLTTVIVVSDALLNTGQRAEDFIRDKFIDKGIGDVAGKAADIPQKVANLGPVALRQFGIGPGDPAYDTLTDLQQAFDTDPLEGLPGSPLGPGVVVKVDASDTGAQAPVPDKKVSGWFDP